MNAERPKPTRIGVAIAVHNGWGVLEPCLEHLAISEQDAELHIVVFDDGSDDGTGEHLAERFPEVHVVRGDGSFWWTGGTNRAVEVCLAAGCDYVLLLNPDVFVQPRSIACLLEASRTRNDAVCAALVADRADPERVIWAGSRWGQVVPGLPIWTTRYLYRRGSPVDAIPEAPYRTSEVHGRAVLFPVSILRRFGLHDDRSLPHYGADTEYSLHLADGGVPLLIVPDACVTLETETTGLGADRSDAGPWRLDQAAGRYWDHLTDRKTGDQLSVWWTISRRHVPWYASLPTFAFIVGVGSVRFWQRELRHANRSKSNGSPE